MKSGRKQRWDELNMEDNLILVEGWARDGLSDKQIFHNLGVSEDVFYKWKRERPEFKEALKKGKEVVDREVENAMYKRAMGYEVVEEKVFVEGDKRRVERTKKQVPPSETAQIFWLKNRKPVEWRDKQEVDQTNRNININIGEWEEDEGEGDE